MAPPSSSSAECWTLFLLAMPMGCLRGSLAAEAASEEPVSLLRRRVITEPNVTCFLFELEQRKDGTELFIYSHVPTDTGNS